MGFSPLVVAHRALVASFLLVKERRAAAGWRDFAQGYMETKAGISGGVLLPLGVERL